MGIPSKSLLQSREFLFKSTVYEGRSRFRAAEYLENMYPRNTAKLDGPELTRLTIALDFADKYLPRKYSAMTGNLFIGFVLDRIDLMVFLLFLSFNNHR